MSLDSFHTRTRFGASEPRRTLYSLPQLMATLGRPLAALPYCLRVLLESLLRNEDGDAVREGDIRDLASWTPGTQPKREIGFFPRRILMPDSSGVPAVCDLAGLRDEVARCGGDPASVDCAIPVDLVVDHSVMVDVAGVANAVELNMAREFERGKERYGMLRWAEQTFRGLRIIPPGSGILHQINLEVLATVVSAVSEDADAWVAPDTLVGTDSHTPMINALGILGWGVGGIEAVSAILGQPISMLVPPVVGCRLYNRLPAGVLATDLVLHLTELFRRVGVVGQFVEFCGPGLDAMPLTDRATVANMAPEWGATIGFFPIDGQTIRYLEQTGRTSEHLRLVESYARAQRLWRDGPEPLFDRLIEVDLASVGTCLAGPRRPQEKVRLGEVPASFHKAFAGTPRGAAAIPNAPKNPLRDGDIVIAAITSCTNTSNPTAMIAAGLLARKAVERGLAPKAWVKTSLSPGSRCVTDYLQATGLQGPLDEIGFQTTGYGCMTCVGNSGPLAAEVDTAVREGDLTVAAVLSGNRNFEGRIHERVRAAYLASPPLVIAYALAGSVLVDLQAEPLGFGRAGEPVYLADLWPADQEIADLVASSLSRELFANGYRGLFEGTDHWRRLDGPSTPTFPWNAASTYLRFPSYAAIDPGGAAGLGDILGARPIAVVGDNFTTDHIAPVGAVAADSAVEHYLLDRGVAPADFDSLLARRGNAEIVARTAFSSTRMVNEAAAGAIGSFTIHRPSGELLQIFDAAQRYRAEGVPLLVVAGANYGAGSSRDTAAKSVKLIGVRYIIAESFERIHRSNLVGMGVLPLQFPAGVTRRSLGIDGSERFDILDVAAAELRGVVRCRIERADGSVTEVPLTFRVDTWRELDWCKSGGILPYVGRRLLAEPVCR
jgi:aconitate hydratase